MKDNLQFIAMAIVMGLFAAGMALYSSARDERCIRGGGQVLEQFEIFNKCLYKAKD